VPSLPVTYIQRISRSRIDLFLAKSLLFHLPVALFVTMPTSTESPAVPEGQGHFRCKAAKQDAPSLVSPSAVDIIDVRRAFVHVSLKEEVLSSFNPTRGPRKLPTLLLYNERGLQLFEDVRCSHTSHILRARG
jgi:hypothetical protein